MVSGLFILKLLKMRPEYIIYFLCSLPLTIFVTNFFNLLQAKERSAGVEIDGHRIRVDYSITKRPHTPTPGIYMGKRK